MFIKILVISHNPFSLTSNNGKTLEAIFKDYNKENLSQLFFSEMIPDTSYCDNYFRITDKNVIKNTICRNRNYYTNSFSNTHPLNNKDQVSKGQCLKEFVKNVPFIRDFLWILGRWKIIPLFDWVTYNKPACIFFVGGINGFSHRIARYLAKKYNIPLVLYFTDDYLINPISRNWSDSFQKMRMKRFYKKTIQQASLCFAIGDIMARTYQEYFGKSFYPIMNVVTLRDKLSPIEHEEYITISYFGGLHLYRWKEILKLGKIFSSIQEENPSLPRIDFNVYTSHCSEENLKLFKEQNINYKGFVSNEKIVEEFSKADILLHVESSDLYYRSLTKLSVSTKIPEYLSTGRCVLGFGPKEVASMRLLDENQVGFVVSSDADENIIKDKLKELISSTSLREELANKAYIYACERFDPKKIRKDFMEKINKIVNI